MSRWKTTAGMAKAQMEVEAGTKVIAAHAAEASIRIASVISETKTVLRQTLTEICAPHKIEWLSIKDLKDGKTSELDGFNNSNLLMVDFTDGDHRPFLSFQLGIREHLSGSPTIVFIENNDTDQCLRLMSAKYNYAPYGLINNELVVFQGMQLDETITLDDFFFPVMARTQSITKPLATKVMRFREAITRARNNQNDKDQRFKEMRQLESMLKADPALITSAHLMDLLLTYRDLKAWPDMIRLINTCVRDSSCAQVPSIQYFVAFALNRRNLGRDRLDALAICEDVCERMPSVDAFGLKGRIYKDMFIESIYSGGAKDYESCENAISAYREIFKLEENLYGGVNLITLLFTSQTYKERKSEIEQICSKLNSRIALRGGVKCCDSYWDVASFFEINVVGEIYALANQACPVMYSMSTANWMMETTMKNVQLIEKIRKQRQALESGEESALSDARIEYEFWCEFFISATSESHQQSVRFAALIQTTGSPRPCYIMIHPATESSDAMVEVMDVIPINNEKQSIARKFSINKLKYLTLGNTPHAHDINVIDKRHISVGVITPKGCHIFSLHFASEELRLKFYDLAVIEGFQESTEDKLNEDEALEWEFDCIGEERRILGIGATAKVYAGINKRTNEEIAIKEMEMMQMTAAGDIEEEVRTIRHLQHQNIIKFLGCEKLPGIFRLFMESIPGGSLTDLLNKFGSLLSVNDVFVDYIGQILEALKYLHGCEIVHRDVKGDNILVNTYTGVLKLADFGTCKRMAGLSLKATTIAGTPWYMAPEVIQSDTNEYGIESDIWSFGCTVWQMSNGKPPFIEIQDSSEVMEYIGMMKVHPDIESSWSDDLKDFLERCFDLNVKKRSTAEELANHKLLNLSPTTARTSSVLSSLFGKRMSTVSSSSSSRSRERAKVRKTISFRTSFESSSGITSPLEKTDSINTTTTTTNDNNSEELDQWTTSRLRQVILAKLWTLLQKHKAVIKQEWIRAIKQQKNIQIDDENFTSRADIVIDLLVSHLKAQQEASQPTEANQLIRSLLFTLGKRESPEFDALLSLLIEQIAFLKPKSKSVKPHFIVALIRDCPDAIQPHWVFFIEQSLTSSIDAIASGLNVTAQMLANRARSASKPANVQPIPEITLPKSSESIQEVPEQQQQQQQPSNQQHRDILQWIMQQNALQQQDQQQPQQQRQSPMQPVNFHDSNNLDPELKKFLERVTTQELQRRAQLQQQQQQQQANPSQSPLNESVFTSSFTVKFVNETKDESKSSVDEILKKYRPKDQALINFIEELGIPAAIADVLQNEHITYKILISDMEKDDLKDIKIPIGIRAQIWAAVDKRRRQSNPMPVNNGFVLNNLPNPNATSRIAPPSPLRSRRTSPMIFPETKPPNAQSDAFANE